jgi:hypothetical protein
VRLNFCCELANFVGCSLEPEGAVGAKFEFGLFKCSSGGGVNNGVGRPVVMCWKRGPWGRGGTGCGLWLVEGGHCLVRSVGINDGAATLASWSVGRNDG